MLASVFFPQQQAFVGMQELQMRAPVFYTPGIIFSCALWQSQCGWSRAALCWVGCTWALRPRATPVQNLKQRGKMDAVSCMFLMSPVEGRWSELEVHQRWLLWQSSSSQAPPEHRALGLHFCSKFSLDDSVGCYQEQRS